MSQTIEVKVPDLGDYKDIPVIEVLVKPGESVAAEDPLITLESDKATMDVPAPAAGVIRELKVKAGDKVSSGTLVMVLEAGAAQQPAPAEPVPGGSPSQATAPVTAAVAEPAATGPAAPTVMPAPVPTAALEPTDPAASRVHAGPSVRQFARVLGVDLSLVAGTGPKGRILREDVQTYVKTELTRFAGAAGCIGFNLPPLPQFDFVRFGPVQTQALTRIRKLSGANLLRNWLTIPHVTQHDAADITELEAFRKSQADEVRKDGVRLTLLAFLIKAVVVALKQHPNFNASLSSDGESLILKQYFNIGVAVDTPLGLVVPVIRDADKKGLRELAKELGAVSGRMRDGKIAAADLQGGCFSISSLGGIGGTEFTPIINAPEVAILGVGKAVTQPVWDGSKFAPRLMLPLSLSYDHRVIDGAQGARFITFLSSVLSDIRRLVL